ncbi:class I adenylate-forming enzyme family protein [Paraburkholderia dilworthii]|uniref:class I adenylate-forming enzyme family protein n=1 Tax=Paraburkholderia dilworthii TaxID=948106 RepID=UPI000421658E|nr:acyl-CoA synthetase [Paraburkholderia dilworthii]
MKTFVLMLVALSVAALVLWLFLAVRQIGLMYRLCRLRHAKPAMIGQLERFAAGAGERVIVELDAPLDWGAASGKLPTKWTVAATHDMVCALGGALAELGVADNERVAVYKRNEFDIFLFSVASNRIGGIAAPINVNLDGYVAAAYVDRLKAKVLVTDRDGLAKLAGARMPIPSLRAVIVTDGGPDSGDACVCDSSALGVEPVSLASLLSRSAPCPPAQVHGADDPAYIFHTSGTTGVPKGVIVSAGGMAQALRSVLLFNLVSRRDCAYLALPLNHQVSHLYLYALYVLGIQAIVGGRIDARHALQTIAVRRLSVFFAFPITYTRMIEEDPDAFDLSSMRIWGTTADVSHEVQQRAFIRYGSFFRRLGIPRPGSLFIDGLGSTEVGIAALLRIVSPWTQQFARRVGRPTPGGPRIRIVDTNGEPVARGTAGRLMIKGPCMFRGYWNAHDLLFSATRDGWWFTGDIVRRERGGEYVHLDREVDVVRGQHGPVYTLLIEESLLKHPAVLDVSVFGIRDGEHEVPAAVVALRSGSRPYGAEELLAELNANLPATERLARIWIKPWTSFPIGATGKTLRHQLRERFGDTQTEPSREGTAAHHAPHSVQMTVDGDLS